MPKQVDHEARRQRIADAVCRLAAREGLEGVSLRHVAAEAGVSMGQVQHYFTTKDEMLLFAFRTLSTRIEARIQAKFEAMEQPPAPRALLPALLTEMFPTDEETRLEAPLWIAFLARAVVRPELGAVLRDNTPMIDFIAAQLRTAIESGEITHPIDPELEATSLLAMADGLLVQIVLDPDRAEAATAALNYQLDRIFGSQ